MKKPLKVGAWRVKANRCILTFIMILVLIPLQLSEHAMAAAENSVPGIIQNSVAVSKVNALAQYQKYYEEQINQALRMLESAESEERMSTAQLEVDAWKAKISDIESLANEGKVTGVTLKIPVYNQLDLEDENGTSLCWSACASMWISYLLNDNVSRTKEIATAIASSERPADYNVCRRWTSLDAIPGLSKQLGITQQQEEIRYTLTMGDIERIIYGGSPFVVLYGAYQDSNWLGHYVIAIGYASAPGHASLIVSIDPMGGISRIQTEDEFRGSYAGDEIKFRTWVHTVRGINTV